MKGDTSGATLRLTTPGAFPPAPAAREARDAFSPVAPPPGLAMAGHLTGQLRAYLAARGLADWDVFFCNNSDVSDVDRDLAAIGVGETDTAVRWEPHPPADNGGEQPADLVRDATDSPGVVLPAGCLWLRRHEIVLARWHVYDGLHCRWVQVNLAAAPAPVGDRYLRLLRDLARLRRRRGRHVWKVITGEDWRDEEIDRPAGDGWDGLVLDPAVRDRLETEVTGFFSEPVAALYRDLDIPYRRGLLLYGPPGNGKTSLVRLIGGMNPDVPGLLLRPGEDFNDGQLSAVVNAWREQAPAILVIEDLDWLFRSARLNVSTFLNILDGVDRRDGGLLLIATTNHPEALDPAINNRPGRFDVAIELASPGRELRLAFFRRTRLAALGDAVLAKVAGMTDGLSFAHLREIESLSGLQAIKDGRDRRTEADVHRAAETVRRSHDDARHGFPAPAVPFGLQAGRGRRE